MPISVEWEFPLFTDHDVYSRDLPRLSDIHIYNGSRCNRECSFCIVDGRPDGWYRPIDEATLNATLDLTPVDGTIKFYGGEPTLEIDNVIWAMRYLRDRGFAGWLTIFTNGVQADRVIRALEADDRSEAVLNFSILHGIDAPPIPPASLGKLRHWAKAHPARIYSSHAGVFPFGPGARFADEVGQAHLDERMGTSLSAKVSAGHLTPQTATTAEARNYRICPRCRPAVATDGRHLACPFAVESPSPHFLLGTTADAPAVVLGRFQQFLTWIDEVLEPEAERRQMHPCRVCTGGLAPLPVYHDAPVA